MTIIKRLIMIVCEDFSFDVRSGKEYKVKSTFTTWNETPMLDMIFHWLHLKHVFCIMRVIYKNIIPRDFIKTACGIKRVLHKAKWSGWVWTHKRWVNECLSMALAQSSVLRWSFIRAAERKGLHYNHITSGLWSKFSLCGKKDGKKSLAAITLNRGSRVWGHFCF